MMNSGGYGASHRMPTSKKGMDLNLKMFDIYMKIEDDFRVQTSSGAYLSIIGWVVIVVLLSGAFFDYMTPQVKEHMIVDTTLGANLRVNVNITFHALTCAEAHLDAMDVAGDNQLNIEDSFMKQRISQDGKLIGDPAVVLIGSNVIHKDEKDLKGNEPVGRKSIVADGSGCGSCYGAESTRFKCCQTCDEIKQAYMARGWSTGSIIKTAQQCLEDMSNPYALVEKGEGCRVSGSMVVNKVAGNFHIAHGESIVRDGRHIHQFIPSEAPGYNISHTIHSISFGDPYPNMPKNPLDGVTKIISEEVGTGLFQYFIKVIPTVYMDGSSRLSKREKKALEANGGWGITSKKRILTNQYTMTERFRPLQLPELKVQPQGDIPGVPPQPAKSQPAVLPGIFFVYVFCYTIFHPFFLVCGSLCLSLDLLLPACIL
jgi:hypothetical protein